MNTLMFIKNRYFELILFDFHSMAATDLEDEIRRLERELHKTEARVRELQFEYATEDSLLFEYKEQWKRMMRAIASQKQDKHQRKHVNVENINIIIKSEASQKENEPNKAPPKKRRKIAIQHVNNAK